MSLIKVFCSMLCLCSSFVYCSLEVTFVDVGQGNCTMVMHDDAPPLIVDCGSTAFQHRAKDFQATQIQRIVDKMSTSPKSKSFSLVISHPDKDHYNWAADLIESTKASIDKVWLGGSEKHYSAKFVKTLQGALAADYSSHAIYPSEKQNATGITMIAATGNLTYTILPSKKCVDKAKDANSASLVVLITFCGQSILLPGDATSETFKHIAECNVSINKVLILLASHHGADDGGKDKCNQKDWIRKIRPEICVISSGTHSGFLHPRSSTIKNFIQYSSGKKVHWHPVYSGSSKKNISCEQPVYFTFDNDYSVQATDKQIYGTVAHGNVTFTLSEESSSGKVSVEVEFDYNGKEYEEKKNCILSAALLGPEHPFTHHNISGIDFTDLTLNDAEVKDKNAFYTFIDLLIQKSDLPLHSLVLDKNFLTSPNSIQKFVALLGKHNIREFSFLGNKISMQDHENLLKVWNNRGLCLEPAV